MHIKTVFDFQVQNADIGIENRVYVSGTALICTLPIRHVLRSSQWALLHV